MRGPAACGTEPPVAFQPTRGTEPPVAFQPTRGTEPPVAFQPTRGCLSSRQERKALFEGRIERVFEKATANEARPRLQTANIEIRRLMMRQRLHWTRPR